jgi:uncharacterized membrane protein YgdD (TMEM256/DUF423 family)
MSRSLLLLGSINAFLAVGLGAFGAHGLQKILSEQALQTWHTAVQYHFYHALGLLLIALLVEKLPAAVNVGWLMFAGILLFSGSLYALSLSGIKILGAITPLGGLCFLAAWLWLAVLAYRM